MWKKTENAGHINPKLLCIISANLSTNDGFDIHDIALTSSPHGVNIPFRNILGNTIKFFEGN